MPTFSYTARLSPGESREGVIEAENPEQAARMISERGMYPVRIVPFFDDQKKGMFSGVFKKRGVGKQDIVNFTRQLASFLESGLNILPALNVIKSQSENPSFTKLVDEVLLKVKEGDSFSESISSYEALFSPLYVNVIKSGEMSGELTKVLDSLADYVEQKEELSQSILSALVYPAMVLAVGVITVLVLLVFVIPKIGAMYEDMGQALPFITQSVVGISSFLLGNFMVIGLVITAAAIFLKRFFSTEAGKEYVDKTALNLPFLKQFILKQQISRFSRTLSMLLSSGIPVVSALELSAATLDSRPLKKEVTNVALNIREGMSLSNAIKKTSFFPAFVTNIISIAEESGTLERSLRRIADSFERDIARTIKSFTSMLEPILILCVGLIVGFIVVSMLLPIFSINLIVT